MQLFGLSQQVGHNRVQPFDLAQLLQLAGHGSAAATAASCPMPVAPTRHSVDGRSPARCTHLQPGQAQLLAGLQQLSHGPRCLQLDATGAELAQHQRPQLDPLHAPAA